MSKAAATTAASEDALDIFAGQGPQQALMIMFWKDRHRNAEMTIQVTEKDIEGFRECIEYLDVKPQIRIYRPQGLPGHPGSPATASKSAVPARAAEPPRPFVVVQMVDATGNGFKPIENSEEGAKIRDQANELRHVRDRAVQLAAQLVQDVQTGTFSNATILEAAGALKTLART